MWLPKKPNWKYVNRGLLCQTAVGAQKNTPNRLKAKLCLLWWHTIQGKKLWTNPDAKMESHQKSATEWLQFCWDFVKPLWNSFATFFLLACSSARIFFYVICAACNFFLPTSACRKFFFKIPHRPPPPQELNGRPLTAVVKYSPFLSFFQRYI